MRSDIRRCRTPRRQPLLLLLPGIVALCLSVCGCAPREPDDGRVHLTYWEKWVRFEGQAMQRVIDEFNASQDRIVVHMHTFGPVDRKTLLATAGGNPPDLAGLWAPQVASFADRRGLTALDSYMARDGLSRDHWIEVYADLCTHNGTMWAVPTTPTTIALHWNKAMFEEAGLDPERPPQTLEELDAYAERLTRYDNDGNIVQMGFLPQEPDWYTWGYGPWFGGTLLADGEVTASHPQNIEALAWMQRYSLKYGVDRVKRFASGFGNFSSPQNAFFARKVAMGFHGVWLHNYITRYAPGMRYGVSAFPKTPHGPTQFCIADTDVLVIPAGVPEDRREAAWEFMKFVSSQRGMELLCLGQQKNTPLAAVSDGFLARHPHPYVGQLIELSRSAGAVHLPQVGIWVRYDGELRAAAERVWLLERNPGTGRPFTPREVLEQVQVEMAQAHKQHQLSLARHARAEGAP